MLALRSLGQRKHIFDFSFLRATKVHPLLKDAYDIDSFRESAHRVVDLLADHLKQSLSGQHSQALPWMAPEDSVKHWEKLANEGMTIESLCAEVAARSVRISDPKYMGHQICVPAPTAMIAGLITDCLNNGCGVYEMGMAGTAMEETIVGVVAKKFGWPQGFSGFMTSGGTLANLTALLAARSANIAKGDPNSGAEEQFAILVSDEAHYCVERAARIMGWGDAGIIRVPTDAKYRMCTEKLPELFAEATQQGKQVVAVVGSACSTSTGAFDGLSEIASFCEQNGIWFHVDGAHGGAVAFSNRHRGLLNGIERADSVAIDFHKMLMTPVLCSALLFRKAQNSFLTFAVEADYLFARKTAGCREQSEEPGEEPEKELSLDYNNLARRTFECTKAMMATKVYSILAIHGERVLEENVNQLHSLSMQFAELIRRRSGFELATDPETNIVCFRFVDLPKFVERPTSDRVGRYCDAMLAVRQRLTLEGEHYIVKTTLRGEVWLRCVLANPFTSAEEMNALLDKIQRYSKEYEDQVDA